MPKSGHPEFRFFVETAARELSVEDQQLDCATSMAASRATQGGEMRWIRRTLAGLVLLAGAAAATAFSIALRSHRPTGFQLVGVVDKDGKTMAMGIWYPTDARPWPTTFVGLNLMDVARDGPVAGTALPLVLISHGTGGGPVSHADLALALAGQGFVVVAPMHDGDNFEDQHALSSAALFVDRTREIHAAVDYMLSNWPNHGKIDANRIGMYGFSAGGFTALAEIGGVPDLRRLESHCAAEAEFVCKLLADAHSPLMNAGGVPPTSAYVHDSRIKAAVVAAPGLGFTFTTQGLASVTVPVQLWTGAADSSVPTATNAGWVSDVLGNRAELHVVPGAGHFSFLVPCGLGGPHLLCTDANGFDRNRFHAAMNEEVVKFFHSKLQVHPRYRAAAGETAGLSRPDDRIDATRPVPPHRKAVRRRVRGRALTGRPRDGRAACAPQNRASFVSRG